MNQSGKTKKELCNQCGKPTVFWLDTTTVIYCPNPECPNYKLLSVVDIESILSKENSELIKK